MAWLESVDVGFLTETERDMILDVLKRDEKLRLQEQQRVMKLKKELRGIKRKGAKNVEVNYPTNICERCKMKTGFIVNKAQNCPVCKHKICQDCRIEHKSLWMCLVCFAEVKIKAETGEWFYDMMRAELKQMSEGSILLKHAVGKPRPTQKTTMTSRDRVAPSITYTAPSQSSSKPYSDLSESDLTSSSSKQDIVRVGSCESIGSSTESHSQAYSTRSNRQGPAETGFISSLRSTRSKESYLSDSEQSTTSSMYSPLHSTHGPHYSSLPRSRLPPLPYNDPATSLRNKSKSQTLPITSRPSEQITIVRSSSISDIASEKEDAVSSKGNSQMRKKFRSAGKKLMSQKSLSKSVPSLFAYHKRSRSSLNKSSQECDMVIEEEESNHNLNKKSSLSTSNIQDNSSHGSTPLSCCGEINFALEFHYKRSILTINIVECRNLVSFPHKKCDAYVKCYLTPDRSVKKKTSIKKNTLSPKFNQELKFSNITMAELSSRVLEMSVWNAGTFGKKIFIGHVQISLDNWKWTNTPHWYPLKPKELSKEDAPHARPYKGDLLMEVCYKPPAPMQASGLVMVMLKQAKNLEPLRSSRGNLNVYAKMCILPIKEDSVTNVVEGNNPIWNSTVRLPLSGINVEESAFKIGIWHKPNGSAIHRTNNHTFLGGAIFSSEKELSTVEERTIWRTICDSPGRWISANICLRVFR
nr:synaptotagmin-like protein 4 isoform X1 [Ciona intestinalis]XP_026696695.1 synaptotagmin-like protein 4 isoform X2 [Ciona intestinalis]|eukprot:XP_018672934.1 synaptotagmin-like protein 4 isoform X1 [Ciona intestinalis]